MKFRPTLAEWGLPSPAVSQKFAVGRFRCFGSDFSLIPRHLHGSRSSFRSLLLASSSSSCFSFVLLTCFCPCFTPWCSSIGFPFPFGSLQGALWFVLQSLDLCSSTFEERTLFALHPLFFSQPATTALPALGTSTRSDPSWNRRDRWVALWCLCFYG